MRWTYGGDPGHSKSDEVRFLVGDTDERNPLLSDGEVAYLLAQTCDVPLLAALHGARALYSRVIGAVNETVGPVSIAFGDLPDRLLKAIAMLEGRAAIELAVPYAGGISRADKFAVESDPDRIPPAFETDMLQTPGVRFGDPRGWPLPNPRIGSA